MGALALLLVTIPVVPALSQDPVSRETDPAVRGTTVPHAAEQGYRMEDDTPDATLLPWVLPDREVLGRFPETSARDSNWVLVEIDTFLTYLPVGETCGIRFDYQTGALSVFSPPDPLTTLALQAIEWAPDWLAIELRDIFSRLDAADQDLYAGIILDTEDPIVDEVAFSIAHTAPEVLTAANFYPELLTENAQSVYAHDPYLDYVDIVDYGSASSGGDYYSTVVYWTSATRDTFPVEMPREIYYWDIVHPKITDELPTYIDPATGGSSAPPTGRFWREFLFNHADAGFPIIRDALAGCSTLWEGNVDSRDNGAIGIITQWILDVMDFGSGAERPIQPVRIYRLHLGRCGEHADITAAVARSCLIPTNSPLAVVSDHTWNEFWDGRWIAWEPVNTYVDSPWHYENWGKSFIGIFSWRGDDWTWTVTHNGYTPHCTLTVAVTDSFGFPVDGAQVTIADKPQPLTWFRSTWSSTDCNGICQFTLGDEHNIAYRIDSSLGTVPPGPNYKLAVEESEAGMHYVVNKSLHNHRPQIPVMAAAIPPGRTDEYQLRLNWQAVGEFIYGENRFDHNTFSEHRSAGAVEFFVCDEMNYLAYSSSDTFYAYEIMEDASGADVTFTFPTNDDWYAVLSNEEHVLNSQVVQGTAELYRRQATDVASAMIPPVATRLERVWPNPFNPLTRISYSLGTDGPIDLAIYDVSGRLVKTLTSGPATKGEYQTCWDGTDSRGRLVAPGIYMCLLETAQSRLCRKMVLIK